MTDRPDASRRRQLREDYKHAEQTAWMASLPLDEASHEALLDDLGEQLDAHGCDHTFRLTERWLKSRDLDAEEVVERYVMLGAGCDCEILANLDPETRG